MKCPCCPQAREKQWHLTCVDCWRLVPLTLQAKVYRLYRQVKNSAAHIAACREVLEIINSKRNA